MLNKSVACDQRQTLARLDDGPSGLRELENYKEDLRAELQAKA
jgi:hypothetical protein